jgi:geranyl-CoA carboxylase alpha subunit
VVHLGERDCSLQRRHQKVIEEAPSPFVDEALRSAMGQAAVNAAKACSYRGVGTVEFLVDEDGSFCFLEMNTRLQVEHPVTELVAGVDLVDWQLKIAAGEELPLTQDAIEFHGHAIEARLYAENPARDFMPQTGPILEWSPATGAGVRVDGGIKAPGEISPFYDSMVAKIIASGSTREEARQRLLRALEQTTLLGVGTNRAFLIQLLEDEVFITGNATTSYIDDGVLQETRNRAELAGAEIALATVVLVRALDPQPDHLANWSNVAPILRSKTLSIDDTEYRVAYRASGGRYQVQCGDETEPVEVVVESGSSESILTARIDGVVSDWPIAFDGERAYIALERREIAVEDQSYRPVRSASAASSGEIVASTEGQVVKVAVAEGERVAAGQLLVVVEAMKMEHRHLADGDGTVSKVAISEAVQVKKNQLLVALELDSAAERKGAS